MVVDPDDAVVPAIAEFLADLAARPTSAASVRSYAYDLLRWWRWLRVCGVEWNRATTAEARGLVLWLSRAVKPRKHPRTVSASTAGTVNPITRKPHLGNGYQPRTIRHSNAVIRSFYEFHREDGRRGPLLNPMPLDAHAWRGYDGAFEGRPRTEGRIRFNPRIPQRLPRAMPDEQWNTVFGMLRSHRDRAIIAMGVSSAARPAELLGMTGPDVDWGEQQIRVVRKGTRAEQWLPVSAEALVWLRLYLAELGELAPTVPLSQTLRRRDRGCGLTRQPLSYDSLRAVFRRLNAALGTNWTLHDLRHTAAIRMSRDSRLSMRDVQVILGHAHLSTTAEVYLVEDQAEVLLRAAEHLAALAAAPAPQPRPAAPYAAADLQVLFGGELR